MEKKTHPLSCGSFGRKERTETSDNREQKNLGRVERKGWLRGGDRWESGRKERARVDANGSHLHGTLRTLGNALITVWDGKRFSCPTPDCNYIEDGGWHRMRSMDFRPLSSLPPLPSCFL
ncbi:hypothetical protein CEXT_538061 [Caerostris extrusa]|uniref:Uncharacterized protein n=1 Tax=Caerostris extrusa TaxID=172846 RepID=A0AAV4XJB4_CAEEX|nr:hypothetical protein CEXT_538061 [Caerostris extrusa]